MISKFRKSADNIFVRLFLGLIAISFVGIGGSIYMQGNSNGDVVTFSKLDPISFEEFQREKTQIVENLQQNSGIELNAESINDLNINGLILKQLITKKMVKYLASYYNFDISDNKIIKLLKQNPAFFNQDKQFDLEKFKAIFQNSPQLQQKYIDSEKNRLIESVILSIFQDSIPVSDMQIDNIIDYVSERKIANIFVMDLHKPRDGYKPVAIEDKALEQFYQENIAQFTLPETRKFRYIKADKQFIQKRIKPSVEELKSYFAKNIDEFESNDFKQIKSQVKESYVQSKTSELIQELSKNLESDVSSGMSFEELADKYSLTINSTNHISAEDMEKNPNQDYVEILDVVFEMDKDEISYPLEIQDQNEVIIAQLLDIIPEQIEPFEVVKDKIIDILNKKMIAQDNFNYISQVRNDYVKSKPTTEELKRNSISVINNFATTRFEIYNNASANSKLPYELLELIVNTDINEASRVVTSKNKIYFAYINKIQNDPKIAKQIRNNSRNNYADSIREGVYVELMHYLTKQNNMQIKMQAK